MTERTARRLAWGLFAATVAMFAVGGAFAWVTRSLTPGSGWGGGGAVAVVVFGLVQAAFPVTGIVVALRRPENPIGWLLLAVSLAWGVDGGTTYADYGLRLHPGSLPAADVAAAIGSPMWAIAIGVTGTFLILLFPDGRLPGPRWRWVAWTSGVAIAVSTALLMVRPGPMSDSGYPHTANPLGISALAGVAGPAQAVIALIPLAMLASAASVVVRFRRAAPLERQQIKWLAAAAAATAGVYAVALAASLAFGPPSGPGPAWLQVLQDLSLVSLGLVPVAIAVAVLRYRLYEIDVLIRKTLVYAVLVAGLAGLYLAGVSLLGGVFRLATGQSGTLAVTVSTLAVAAAFQPLRSRIQRAVDRRFYRARYDADRTLEAFSERLRDELELEALEAELLALVGRTVRPGHATLWLRPQEERA